MFNISVIIPIYNGDKYLRECLNSIFNQTLKNIEVICVNDGSTDNTYSILNEYSIKHENLKIINTEHKGQGHARNIALSIAKGEYIAFVDADTTTYRDEDAEITVQCPQNDCSEGTGEEDTLEKEREA